MRNLLPQRCYRCGGLSQSPLCLSCRARVTGRLLRSTEGTARCSLCGQICLAEEDRCSDCRDKSWTFVSLDGLVSYDDPGNEALRLYKFHGHRSLASLWIHELASKLVPRAPLVPVPPHPKHLLDRGWDPVDYLSRRLSSMIGLPVLSMLRRRSTTAQKSQSQQGRWSNALASYELRKTLGVMPERVWLVDDVVTTGATVEACSELLRRAGISRVDVLCVSLH